MDRLILKESALRNLTKNWTVAMLGMVMMGVFGNLSSLGYINLRLGITGVLAMLVLLPMYVGYARMHYNIALEKNGEVGDVFSVFNRDEFGRAWFGLVLYFVYMIGWTLLFIIPGLVKSLSYAMTVYILQDPDFKKYSGDEAITVSREMMHGHKMELLKLQLSFTLWFLLIPFTLGAAAFYVVPYFEQMLAEFYLRIKKKYNPREFRYDSCFKL